MTEKTSEKPTYEVPVHRHASAQLVEGHVPLDRNSINFSSNLNKRQVVTGEVTRTRGKAFGFHCEVCDLTFKDNLKFVDHLNSKPHLIRSGELNKNYNVTLDEVKERFEMLSKKIDESMAEDEKVDIKKRIEKRREFDVLRKMEKKAKKQVRKERADEKPRDEMSMMMGFRGFGTTKK